MPVARGVFFFLNCKVCYKFTALLSLHCLWHQNPPINPGAFERRRTHRCSFDNNGRQAHCLHRSGKQHANYGDGLSSGLPLSRSKKFVWNQLLQVPEAPPPLHSGPRPAAVALLDAASSGWMPPSTLTNGIFERLVLSNVTVCVDCASLYLRFSPPPSCPAPPPHCL